MYGVYGATKDRPWLVKAAQWLGAAAVGGDVQAMFVYALALRPDDAEEARNGWRGPRVRRG